MRRAERELQELTDHLRREDRRAAQAQGSRAARDLSALASSPCAPQAHRRPDRRPDPGRRRPRPAHQDRPEPARRDRRRRAPRRPGAAHPAHGQGDVPHLHGRRPAGRRCTSWTPRCKTKDIKIPVIPVALGGAAMVTAAYWAAGGAVMAAFALTLLAILIGRMFGGTDGYVKDVTAGVFATAYLRAARRHGLRDARAARRRQARARPSSSSPSAATSAATSPASRSPRSPAATRWPPSSARRRPGKAWRAPPSLSIVAGAIVLPALLHGHWWQGVITRHRPWSPPPSSATWPSP